MNLIFINHVGKNYEGYNIYEFLFTTEDIKKVGGDNWDAYPANGSPMPPVDYVNLATKIETKMTLELIQNHESFSMADCQDGIIALAWEDDYDYNPSSIGRLFFSYGEKLEDVKNKLYAQDINLENYNKNVKKN